MLTLALCQIRIRMLALIGLWPNAKAPKQATNARIPSFSHRSALATEDQETRCVGKPAGEGKEWFLARF